MLVIPSAFIVALSMTLSLILILPAWILGLEDYVGSAFNAVFDFFEDIILKNTKRK